MTRWHVQLWVLHFPWAQPVHITWLWWRFWARCHRQWHFLYPRIPYHATVMSEVGPWFLPPRKCQVCVCKQPQQPGLNKTSKQGEETIYKLPRTDLCIQKLTQIFPLPQTISSSSGKKKCCLSPYHVLKRMISPSFPLSWAAPRFPPVCFRLQLPHASISIRLRSHLHLVHIQSPKCSSMCDLGVGSAVRKQKLLKSQWLRAR